MLQRALYTHHQSEKPQDAEWVHMVLSFLKTYVENMDEEMLIQGYDKVEYVSTLVESLKQSLEALDNGELRSWTNVNSETNPVREDIIQPDHPVLFVRVSENARLAETRDGSYIDATVTNYLPCVRSPALRCNILLNWSEDSSGRAYYCYPCRA